MIKTSLRLHGGFYYSSNTIESDMSSNNKKFGDVKQLLFKH